MVGTGKLFRVLGINFMTSGLLYTSQSTLSSVFDFGLLQAELHFLQNRQENAVTDLVHFGYCHYVIKYLKRDMMDYHCLRVFRSGDRRIGKHSPGFSVLLSWKDRSETSAAETQIHTCFCRFNSDTSVFDRCSRALPTLRSPPSPSSRNPPPPRQRGVPHVQPRDRHSPRPALR